MTGLKTIITTLSKAMSITGHERRAFDTVRELVCDAFDEIYSDPIGSLFLVRRCGKDNAPCIMLDAHLDEIGMIVTGIKDNGFLSVANIGGIDTRILPASIVRVYGEEEFDAVVVSTPPHLQKPGDANKLPAISDILIDTGYTSETLKKIAPVGTPVGFEPAVTELLNGRLAGKGMDDKACAAILLDAVMNMEKPEDFDIVVTLTTREEVSGVGARCAAYGLNPTAAIIFDVNFAKTPDVDKSKSLTMDEGLGVSISAVTHRRLTKSIIEYAKENEIKSTGTNADNMPSIGYGLAVAVVSLPLKNMHTPSEIISLEDAENCSKLISGYVSSRKWML